MPHGIVFLATRKNNNNCYLLFEQPSKSPLSPPSHSTPLLTTSAPLQKPFVVTSTLETYYAKNRLLAKNSISTARAPHQKVPTPHPGCSTSHQVPKGPTPLLALLLTSIRDLLLATYALLPRHLSKNSHPKNSEDFYYRNSVLGTITINKN